MSTFPGFYPCFWCIGNSKVLYSYESICLYVLIIYWDRNKRVAADQSVVVDDFSGKKKEREDRKSNHTQLILHYMTQAE